MKNILLEAKILSGLVLVLFLASCSKSTSEEDEEIIDEETMEYAAITSAFQTIDLENLDNYANQIIPNYINKDNTGNNVLTDKGATLGRVLFYDKNLSIDNTIACASCHQQEFGFSDIALLSEGVNGQTARHSMRIINARFGDEGRFFWDERALSLEDQTTQPIQDFIEMGFSGDDGIDRLIGKMNTVAYYPEFFHWVYGDSIITEERLQNALSQFIRSIQSFDSKYDEGLTLSNNVNADFSNFTNEENQGKRLFMTPPPMGGAGCNVCHRSPEFDIMPNSDNNGVIGVAGSNDLDLDVTRAPSLRNMTNADGTLNGPLMHNGEFNTLLGVINHYNNIPNNNQNNRLDRRLRNQQLNLSEEEKNALVAFLETLSGNEVYTDEKYSDPF